MRAAAYPCEGWLVRHASRAHQRTLCRATCLAPGRARCAIHLQPSRWMHQRVSAGMDEKPFRLPDELVAPYRSLPAPFGFNALGELVYRRTYSRLKPDGTNEQWCDTVERVVNGTFNMQKRWTRSQNIQWDESKAQSSALGMFKRIFEMKFLPPGRGLWAMGTPITEERGLYAALNNCAFVSTENMHQDGAKPFTFLMDAAMLGVGVGFDTRGAGSLSIQRPTRAHDQVYVVPDSREGWVESLGHLLEAYFVPGVTLPHFDYGLIRPAGAPIRGFGGTSAGPGCLEHMHQSMMDLLDSRSGQDISVTTIVDLMNIIGQCVVAGNVRRTAEIAFGDADVEEYLDLKDYQRNPHRAAFGWTSNNSVFARLGMDYGEVCKRIVHNGEPGLAWLDNMRAFSRMNGARTNADANAMGGNPCLEQTLEPFEMCCLVETFPANHENKADYLETLKFAFMYAKTVTLGQTHWPESNSVMLRNRRIGCSMSGIAQFISARGLEELRDWCEDGYDEVQRLDSSYSKWLCIPRSIKTTSVKPSGTVSLLAGATPGMHYPIASHYIRRVRLSKASELVKPLLNAGYKVEPSADGDANTVVVEIPVCVEAPSETGRLGGRHSHARALPCAEDVGMWEQLALAAFLQRHWADNQVSCTVSFDPEKEGPQLPSALNYFQYQLKGVSFLPTSNAVYPQMPYEAISREKYDELMAGIRKVDYTQLSPIPDPNPEEFCDADSCEVSR